jgi:hypothetical protein
LFARVAKVARRRLGVPVLRDEPPDHRAAVFVAGSGRSGTTWLSELLLSGTQRRYVFEPLSRHVPQTAVFHRDLVKLYLRPDGEYPEHVAAMRDVLTGRVRSRWTERFNRRIVAEGRLVKEIRANLLLGWLQTNFPEMPIVLLLRHPCAVAASFVREGWVGRLGDLLAQPDLVADHLTGTQVELLARLARGSTFDRAIGLWCVETRVALRQARQGMFILCYESLSVEPEVAFGELLRWLGREGGSERVGGRLTRDSTTTRGARAATIDRISDWRRALSRSEIRRALEAVSAFELDLLYHEDPMPDLRVRLEPWLPPAVRVQMARAR